MVTKRSGTKLDRSRETYRGTSLIARSYGDAVRGKAWRDGHELASIEGGETDAVLTTLRGLVDAAFTVEIEQGSVEYPDSSAYTAALAAHISNLTDKYRRMLQAHYAAVDRTMTARELAAAAGYPNWTSANLHYGKIGRMLGEYLLFQPRERVTGGPIWTLLLAEGATKDDSEDLWQWQLREQVARALEATKLV